MTNEKKDRKYDMEERTAKFGENIILFCKKLRRSPINDPLVTQLVKAGKSIGANYCEADDAVSKADFRNKIGTCKKESRESKHFIRMIVVAVPELKPEARILWREAKELNLIFNAIFRKLKD